MTTGQFYEMHSRLHGGASFGKRMAQVNPLLRGEPWLATKSSAPLRPFGKPAYFRYGAPDAFRVGLAALASSGASYLESPDDQ